MRTDPIFRKRTHDSAWDNVTRLPAAKVCSAPFPQAVPGWAAKLRRSDAQVDAAILHDPAEADRGPCPLRDLEPPPPESFVTVLRASEFPFADAL